MSRVERHFSDEGVSLGGNWVELGLTTPEPGLGHRTAGRNVTKTPNPRIGGALKFNESTRG
jgi:hypothetical protein